MIDTDRTASAASSSLSMAAPVGGLFHPMARGPMVTFAPEGESGGADDGGEAEHDFPLDDDDSGSEEGQESEDEVPLDGEGGEKRPAAKKEGEQERSELAPDEVRRRYENTRTALAEERRTRRELERRLEALERGESPRRETQERRQVDREEEIDPEVDPMGALKQMRAKIAAYEQQDRLESQSQAERDRQEQNIQRIERAFADHEADFREDQPDYDAAAKHYAESRARELLSFGIEPENIKTMLREEFAKLASTAIKARKNPAAVVYAMAKGRGYTPGGKKDDPGGEKGKASSKLKDIARGAKAQSALQNGGGRGSGGVDAETISRINIRTKAGREAFEREFAKLENEARTGGGRR